MMVVKITVICDSQRPNHRLSLLKLFRDLDLYPTNIITRDNSFLVIFKHNFNQDILFSRDSIAKLRELDCSLVEPPILRASRTILVFRVDPYLYGEDTEDIRRDIESSNDHSKIDEIIKFPNSRTIKIIFSSEKAARLAMERGLIACYLYIPPEDIEKEIHVDLKTCLKCYKINDHTTNECDKASDYKICSICSSKEHTHRQCSSTLKKCLNCGGGHSAMSFSCEMRREAIREQREVLKSSRTPPPNVSQPSTPYQLQPSDFPAITRKQRGSVMDDSLRCYMALVLSSWKNKENPGTFNAVLNNLLKKNNLPAMDASDINSITSDCPSSLISDDIEAILSTDSAISSLSPPKATREKIPGTTTIAAPAVSLPPPNTSADTIAPHVSVTSPTTTSSSSLERTVSTPVVATPIAQVNTTEATTAVLSSSVSRENNPTSQPSAKRELRSSKKPITIYSTKHRNINADNLEQLIREKKICMFAGHTREFALAAVKCDSSCAIFKVVPERDFKILLRQ